MTKDRPPEASGAGGFGNLQGTGTETSTVPPQTEEAAVTSTVGRELVLYVDPDTLPLSTVRVCTDEEAREIINLDDFISDDDDEPLHDMFYTVKEEDEEEAFTTKFETGAGSSGHEFYSEQPPCHQSSRLLLQSPLLLRWFHLFLPPPGPSLHCLHLQPNRLQFLPSLSE